MKTTTRADLLPVIKKIKDRRPLLATFADLWITAYTIRADHQNLAEFERVVLGDLFNGQYNPNEFLTGRESRIAAYFYDRGSTVRPPKGKKMEYQRPQGQIIGEFYKGAHWSPVKTTEVLQEVSGDPASYTSQTIQGTIGAATAFNRPHFTITTEKGEFLLPDHGALMQRLKLVDDQALVWIGYKGMVGSSEGRSFHSYEVVRIAK